MPTASNVSEFAAGLRARGMGADAAAAEVFKAISLGGLPYAPTADVLAAVNAAFATPAQQAVNAAFATPAQQAVNAEIIVAEGDPADQAGPRLALPRWAAVRSENPPKLAPELVGGLLRCGHTGLLVGRAKSNKSWCAIALAVAVATGREWLGHACKQGRVLFCDPELDPRSLDGRFRKVCEAMGADPAAVDRQVTRWSLRGALTASGAAPTVADVAHDLAELRDAWEIRRGDINLVIIDSCSALLAGDENAAQDVRRFHNTCLRIAEVTGASVMCVHHEGKAATGDVDAISRGRGSSAWSDAFDLVLSLAETFPPSGEASDYLAQGERAFVLDPAAIREFPPADPTRLIFGYPVFRIDAEGVTDGWKPRSSQQTAGRASGDTRKARAALRSSKAEAAILAFMYQHDAGDDGISLQDAIAACSDLMGEEVPASTLKRFADEWQLLDLYKPSPKRCNVVPRHPRQRGDPLLLA